MNTKQYTAEDFANAEFARHQSGVVAARFYDRGSMPWITGDEISLGNEDMADHGWVPVREAVDQPITLDALQDAWEGAEVADECNGGDILILRHPDDPTGRVEVWRSGLTGRMDSLTRILHRAPKREPWQDLADVLRAHTGEPDPDGTAKMLHERGVRMTEEGEKDNE